MVSESNFHTTKFVAENLLPIEMEKTEIPMNKYVYLGLSVLKLSKILLHECWYDYVKPNYGENAKPCYMDTFSFTFMWKEMIFVRTLEKILKQVLCLQILN